MTGNPRTDQLWRAVEPDRLAALGITGRLRGLDADVPPGPRGRRDAGRSRSRPTPAERRTAPSSARSLDGLRARGIQLVVKPHPMDADRREWPGAVTVDEADLAAAGVSLYELLGSSSGLVTDYSSVWVDYLLIDRPIAFLVPDRDTYDRELCPRRRPRLGARRGRRSCRRAVRGVPRRPRHRRSARRRASGATVAAVIGLNQTATAADDLVTALVKLGVLGSA